MTPTITGNTIRNNTGTAVLVNSTVTPILSGNTINSNGVNGVSIAAVTLAASATWDSGNPYVLQGTLTIEWPERLGNLIPAERLWVNFDHVDEEQRRLRFQAQGARYDALLGEIRRSVIEAG